MITRISTIFFAFALVIFMTASAATAADDIRNSRHNLSVTGGWNTTTGTGGVGYSALDNALGNRDNEDNPGATTRICVFCHTPHASAGMMVPVPLWNKNYKQPPGGYNQHDHEEVAALMGGTSLACLQCHDGTQALDVMLNSPGSGNWNGSGMMSGKSAGYGFAEFSIYDGTDGGTIGPTEVSYIGTDLMNDHPINILYAEGTCLGTGTAMMPMGMTCAADDEFREATWDEHHGWEAGPEAFPLEIRNLSEFPDFTPPGAETIGAAVGCYSCHNPHLGNWDADNSQGSFSVEADATQMFLRVADNIGSGVCLNCHVK